MFPPKVCPACVPPERTGPSVARERRREEGERRREEGERRREEGERKKEKGKKGGNAQRSTCNF
jgi:hypothetical protein